MQDLLSMDLLTDQQVMMNWMLLKGYWQRQKRSPRLAVEGAKLLPKQKLLVVVDVGGGVVLLHVHDGKQHFVQRTFGLERINLMILEF